MRTPITGASAHEVEQFIRWFGVMAVLNTDLSVAEQVEVADALLAAPILSVAVALDGHAAQEAIAALHQRHQGNLLIGASHVRSLPDARGAVAGGAQFLLGETDDDAIRRYAADRHVLYVPRVDPARIEPSADSLALAVLDRHAPRLPARKDDAPAPWLVAGQLLPDNAPLWTAPTVAAAAFGYAHVPGIHWNATDFIVRARALRALWEARALG